MIFKLQCCIYTDFCVDSEREALNRLQPATVPLLLNRENNKVHNTLFFYVVEPWTSITRASSQEGLFQGSLLSCGQYYGSASLTQKLIKRLVEGGPYDHVGNPHQKCYVLVAGGCDWFWYQMCEHWFLRVVQVGGRLKHKDLKGCDAACNASVIDAMVQWANSFCAFVPWSLVLAKTSSTSVDAASLTVVGI